MSALAAAGIDVDRFTFGIRYDHGLTNLDRAGEVKAKNRAWIIFGGFRIGR